MKPAMRNVAACLGWAFAAAAAAQTTRPSVQESVAAVLGQLVSESYPTRQQGVSQMLELPPEALPLLEDALRKTTDPEVKARLQSNIERMRTKARDASKAARARQIGIWETQAAIKGFEGKRPEAWDAAVKTAFDQIPRLYDGGCPDAWQVCSRDLYGAFRKAIDAGCRDPLVVAYWLRTGERSSAMDAKAAEGALPFVYPAILDSNYEPALRFMGVLDYLDTLQWVDPEGVLWPQEERAGALNAARAFWTEIVKDKAVPDSALEVLAQRFCKRAVGYNQDRMDILAWLFDPWIKARPDSAGAYALKASLYVGYARELHGERYGNILEGKQLEKAEDRVAQARVDAGKAYALDATDPWAPTSMIDACGIIPTPRKEMETWFARAIEADPDNVTACTDKLHYLRDQVGPDAMLEFGRQCAVGGRWQGAVPLTLINAHREIASTSPTLEAWTAYFQSDAVWADYALVFTGILAAHKGDGTEAYYRSIYANDACVADRWAIAREQFRILGNKPDLAVIKSMTTYNYLRRKADGAAVRATPPASP